MKKTIFREFIDPREQLPHKRAFCLLQVWDVTYEQLDYFLARAVPDSEENITFWVIGKDLPRNFSEEDNWEITFYEKLGSFFSEEITVRLLGWIVLPE